ncbi:signal recognition particle, SRP9/SRP14 subunit [Lepidopterella palustris CBS 459.81]|uniref:Signal recognition particle subunit SRP14 n=1 Tax=Lepidopterella palustris CBS 459.81 TaxID=1314670 RepID=A0A8E2EFW0_9PEZI|nr:signal recognition particle, SRP9/SRP14 subunit [Lepidopterella palustris CBS 459.81]
MAREHLSNDEFFTNLSGLLEANRKKGHGSVFLTQKRLNFSLDFSTPVLTKVADDPLWDTHPENPLPLIVRASNSKSTKRDGSDRKAEAKVKFSTVVQPDAIDRFFARYAEVCKAGMSAMKKRDRTKKKKDKRKKVKAGV